MFLSSTQIGVFPTTGRPQYDPLGRLTTEYNLTSIINTLLDTDGFVITQNISGYEATNVGSTEFQFNIKGYIFTIHKLEVFLNNLDEDLKSATKLYASIQINSNTSSINTNENLNKLQSIEGSDNEDGQYEGLTISSSEPINKTSKVYYSLYILEKRSDKKWYIPEESKVRLRTGGVQRSLKIDDGELG